MRYGRDSAIGKRDSDTAVSTGECPIDRLPNGIALRVVEAAGVDAGVGAAAIGETVAELECDDLAVGVVDDVVEPVDIAEPQLRVWRTRRRALPCGYAASRGVGVAVAVVGAGRACGGQNCGCGHDGSKTYDTSSLRCHWYPCPKHVNSFAVAEYRLPMPHLLSQPLGDGSPLLHD